MPVASPRRFDEASFCTTLSEDLKPFLAAEPATEESFREFVTRVKPRYRWYRHCLALADVLQRVADGEIRRLMVFMPPRHGKSEEVSRLFTAYYLLRHPDRWVGINSYAAELAFTLSRSARENFLSGGGSLKGDAKAVKHWETTSGGGLWAAGVGGPITGKGFHLGVIDDPLKNAEAAASEKIRAKQKDWYNSTFYTREEAGADGRAEKVCREEPGGAIVVISTLWDEDDLPDWLIALEAEEDGEPEHWHIVCLPAVREDPAREFPATCTVEPDWREAGEALCPERYPVERLRRIEKRIGEYYWSALYQQRPRPLEGRIFRLGWFEGRYRELPRLAEVWSCWDTALKAGQENDETACVTGGRGEDGNVFLLRMVHGRWETPDVGKFLVAQAKWLRELYGDRYRGDYVEDKNSGTTLIQYLRREHPEVPVIAVSVEADKEARARGVTPLCEAGRVMLPDLVVYPQARGWVGALLSQLAGFPGGRHDDIVDAFVYLLKRFMGTLGGRKSKRGKRGGQV